MTVQDLIKNVDTFIGDTSTDRLSLEDRYQAITEGTAWLLEELGNEHMVDRTEIEYLPTVTWYKMDSLTPYLLTAGQLRFKEEKGDRVDFTRVEARDLATMEANRTAYAIERFNDSSYLGIVVPETYRTSSDEGAFTEFDFLSSGYAGTYTGINATGVFKESNAVRFDMAAGAQTSTGLSTVTAAQSLANYDGTGVLIFEIEIPDITDVTSVAFRFGTDLTTNYYNGVANQDVNGNALVAGVNTIKIKWADLTVVGSPSLTAITNWRWTVNHLNTKPIVEGFKLSDFRVAKPIYLNFKYLFFRVGKNAAGTDLIEFTASTDVPFFSERYPQYRYAVAHKAAGILFRGLRLPDDARTEHSEATKALDRYRKNFSGERDMPNSAFKVAGISFRNRRIIRRRN